MQLVWAMLTIAKAVKYRTVHERDFLKKLFLVYHKTVFITTCNKDLLKIDE